MPICLRLFMHFARAAASRTFCTAGNRSPTRIAIIAITTRSSMSVKARGIAPVRCCGGEDAGCLLGMALLGLRLGCPDGKRGSERWEEGNLRFSHTCHCANHTWPNGMERALHRVVGTQRRAGGLLLPLEAAGRLPLRRPETRVRQFGSRVCLRFPGSDESRAGRSRSFSGLGKESGAI